MLCPFADFLWAFAPEFRHHGPEKLQAVGGDRLDIAVPLQQLPDLSSKLAFALAFALMGRARRGMGLPKYLLLFLETCSYFGEICDDALALGEANAVQQIGGRITG